MFTKYLKRAVSFALCGAMLVGAAGMAPLVKASTLQMSFPVFSDIHIGENGQLQADKWRAALNDAKAEMPNYAVAPVTGDFTHVSSPSQRETFYDIFNETKPDGAKVLTLLGNYDFWHNTNLATDSIGPAASKTDAINRLKENVDNSITETYYAQVVGGYHFIVLSYESNIYGGDISDAQFAFLRAELAKAKAEDANKPIFVFYHIPMKDTVAGYKDEYWEDKTDSQTLYNILKEYPQVFYFSGHSNYPGADPLSVYTKDFTAIGMGSLGETSDASGNIDNTNAEYMRVNIYDDKVELQHRAFKCEIDASSNRVTATKDACYTGTPVTVPVPFKALDADTKAPVFPTGAQIAVSNYALNKARISFPKAVDDTRVAKYTIKLNGITQKEIKTDFWTAEPESYSFDANVTPNMAYAVEVTATDFYGNTSSKLSANFKSTATGDIEMTGTEWYNELETVQVNREPAHTNYMPYDNLEQAKKADRANTENSNYLNLNGTWKFDLVMKPEDRPDLSTLTADTAATWKDISVPGCWQMGDYGDKPIFTNWNYAWVGVENPGFPIAPTQFNPVGTYVKQFERPAAWADKDVYIMFQGVESAYYLYVNGRPVGYSENSFSQSEFNIGSYLKDGANTIAVQVFRFSDGSYFEDYDFLRLSGIFRDTYLYAAPKTHIQDFTEIGRAHV